MPLKTPTGGEETAQTCANACLRHLTDRERKTFRFSRSLTSDSPTRETFRGFLEQNPRFPGTVSSDRVSRPDRITTRAFGWNTYRQRERNGALLGVRRISVLKERLTLPTLSETPVLQQLFVWPLSHWFPGSVDLVSASGRMLSVRPSDRHYLIGRAWAQLRARNGHWSA